MPTVLGIGPYRVFFYSGDREEPPHVHVEREDKVAKFWLEPVRLERNRGFGPIELGRLDRLIRESADLLREKWNEFFGA